MGKSSFWLKHYQSTKYFHNKLHDEQLQSPFTANLYSNFPIHPTNSHPHQILIYPTNFHPHQTSTPAPTSTSQSTPPIPITPNLYFSTYSNLPIYPNNPTNTKPLLQHLLQPPNLPNQFPPTPNLYYTTYSNLPIYPINTHPYQTSNLVPTPTSQSTQPSSRTQSHSTQRHTSHSILNIRGATSIQ